MLLLLDFRHFSMSFRFDCCCRLPLFSFAMMSLFSLISSACYAACFFLHKWHVVAADYFFARPLLHAFYEGVTLFAYYAALLCALCFDVAFAFRCYATALHFIDVFATRFKCHNLMPPLRHCLILCLRLRHCRCHADCCCRLLFFSLRLLLFRLILFCH